MSTNIHTSKKFCYFMYHWTLSDDSMAQENSKESCISGPQTVAELRAANLWQIGNCGCSSIISVVRPNCVLIGGAIDCCGVE